LRSAYFIKCVGVVKDESTGVVTELRCTYDPATRGGDAPDGRKVKATIHWVSAAHAVDAEARLYGHLFLKPNPDDAPEGLDWKSNLNPKSLDTLSGCKLEPSLAGAKPGDRFQFERIGYFCVDADSEASSHKPQAASTSGLLVFNRTATLRDEWAKVQARMKAEG
jgi:glutaminyl-tRNA synthetase